MNIQHLRKLPAVSKKNHVLGLIDERIASGSQPGAREDGCKLGLVIEGGGMRGVVTAAMVAALEQLSLRDAFDVVYGSSAGAISGAYFVAGAARLGTTIFYENICNRNFINTLRFFAKEPVISFEYLLDFVCETEKPLDWERVVRSPIKLVMVASLLTDTDIEPVAIRRVESKEELKEALRASSRFPIISGSPVVLRGMRLIDATVTAFLPCEMAVEDGCTHILVLLSRPRGKTHPKPAFWERFFSEPLLRRYHPKLPEVFINRHRRYERLIEGVIRLEDQAGKRLPHVLSIAADPAATEIKQLETDRDCLIEGAASGKAAVLEIMGGTAVNVGNIIRELKNSHIC